MAIKLKSDKITQGENHVIYSTIIPESVLGTINGKGWVRFYGAADASQVTMGYADISSVVYMPYNAIELGDSVDAQNIGQVDYEAQIVTLVTFTAEFDEVES